VFLDQIVNNSTNEQLYELKTNLNNKMIIKKKIVNGNTLAFTISQLLFLL